MLVLVGGLGDAYAPLSGGRPSGVVGRFDALPDHEALGLGVAVAGLVLLTWAWWDLLREARGHDGVRRTRLAAAVWAAPLLVGPPLFSRDGWSYVATGYLTRIGKSPYVWTPSILPEPLRSGVDPHWRHTPSPYGVLPLEWGAAWARLTASPWLLLYAYRLLAVLGLVLLAWAVPRLAARVGRDPGHASALVVASPFVLVQGIGGLHNDLLMAALMLTALVATRRDRWVVGAVLVGVAASVKVTGGFAAVGVVLLSLPVGAGLLARLRRTVLVGAVAGAVLWLGGLASGLGTGWWHALRVPTNERTPFAVTDVLGVRLHHLLHRIGGERLVHRVEPIVLIKDLGLLVLLAVAVWVLLVRRRGDDRSVLAGTAGVLAAATLLSPAVHYWYALWCLPLIACLPLRRRGAEALVALIAVLGPTAIADPSLQLHWLVTVAVDALVCVPLAAYLLADRRVVAPPRSVG